MKRDSDSIDNEANFRAGGYPHETYSGQYEDTDAYFRDSDLEKYDDRNATRHGEDARQGYGNRYSNRDYTGGKDQQRNQFNYEDYPYHNDSDISFGNPFPSQWSGNQNDVTQNQKSLNHPSRGNRQSFQTQRENKNNRFYNKNYGWDSGQSPSEKYGNSTETRKTSKSGRTGFGGRNRY